MAVATNGTVITLAADNALSLWSNTGTLLDSSSAIDGTSQDLAISTDGTQVYVTGYTQASNLQIPYIRA